MIRLWQVLWSRRELVRELAQRELLQGHGSHFLGGIWVLANPLILLFGYFFVFHTIFPSRLPSGGSSEVFLIAGLIQWILISETLAKSCLTLRSNVNLVKQINFPIETLFAKTVLASLFVQVIMTIGLVVLIVLVGQGLSVQAIGLWILALLLQAAFLLGIALLVGAVTPFIPDIGEGVGIVARFGLFVTPILYTADQFGSVGKVLFHLNPFSYFAWIHQDALYAQAVATPFAWVGAAFIAATTLTIGTVIFRTFEHAFADVL